MRRRERRERAAAAEAEAARQRDEVARLVQQVREQCTQQQQGQGQGQGLQGAEEEEDNGVAPSGRDVQPALVIGRHYVTERDSAPVQYNDIV